MIKRVQPIPANLPLFNDLYRRNSQPAHEPKSVRVDSSALEQTSKGWNFDNPTPEEDEAQQRAADSILFQRNTEDLLALYRAEVMKSKYRVLVSEVARRGISLNPREHAETKKQLLESLFPGQFLRKQDLTDYSLGEIGRVFAGVYRYAQGHRGKSRVDTFA